MLPLSYALLKEKQDICQTWLVGRGVAAGAHMFYNGAMNLPKLLGQMQRSPYFKERITAWHEVPERDAVWADFPPGLDPRLVTTMRRLGFDRLYSHQQQATAAALRGEHLVVVTPTASGKTL